MRAPRCNAAAPERYPAELMPAGIPAYLEASTPRNAALYARHGYLPQPNAPFYLPGDGPPMIPMWRPLWSFWRPTPEAAATR